MSIEASVNTEYASLSGKIRTFVVDKTLTISGACADARATGEAIEKNAAAAAEERLKNILDSTMTSADKAAQAAAVGKLIEVRPQIVTGSYVGTGEFTGTSSGVTEGSTVLHFPSAPKILIIQSEDDMNCRQAFVALRGIEENATTGSTKYSVYLTWGDDSVLLQTYTNHTDFKGYSPIFNKTGTTYFYTALL